LNLLLDTHAALWWWAAAPELSARSMAALEDTGNTVFFSAISGYEIFQKVRTGKLELPEELARDLPAAVRQEGWEFLDLSLADGIRAARIDHPHRDPFDRILAAQCESRGMCLVTADPFFPDLGIATCW